jgi:hypothetical protein
MASLACSRDTWPFHHACALALSHSSMSSLLNQYELSQLQQTTMEHERHGGPNQTKPGVGCNMFQCVAYCDKHTGLGMALELSHARIRPGSNPGLRRATSVSSHELLGRLRTAFPLYELHVYSSTGSEVEAQSECGISHRNMCLFTYTTEPECALTTSCDCHSQQHATSAKPFRSAIGLGMICSVMLQLNTSKGAQ